MNIKSWYAAVEAFGPTSGDSWDSYVRESGLKQLTQVITLDDILCPNIITELTPEDWENNVSEDYEIFYFRNLDYLLKRIGNLEGVNILALIRNPDEECSNQSIGDDFVFQGYDLIEVVGSNSALTNCGGFDKAFDNNELSSVGLLSTLKRASEVQNLLLKNYSDEPHANCDVWAIWKMRR
jgi:hypothetical protein